MSRLRVSGSKRRRMPACATARRACPCAAGRAFPGAPRALALVPCPAGVPSQRTRSYVPGDADPAAQQPPPQAQGLAAPRNTAPATVVEALHTADEHTLRAINTICREASRTPGRATIPGLSEICNASQQIAQQRDAPRLSRNCLAAGTAKLALVLASSAVVLSRPVLVVAAFAVAFHVAPAVLRAARTLPRERPAAADFLSFVAEVLWRSMVWAAATPGTPAAAMVPALELLAFAAINSRDGGAWRERAFAGAPAWMAEVAQGASPLARLAGASLDAAPAWLLLRNALARGALPGALTAGPLAAAAVRVALSREVGGLLLAGRVVGGAVEAWVLCTFVQHLLATDNGEPGTTAVRKAEQRYRSTSHVQVRPANKLWTPATALRGSRTATHPPSQSLHVEIPATPSRKRSSPPRVLRQRLTSPDGEVTFLGPKKPSALRRLFSRNSKRKLGGSSVDEKSPSQS
ncbi:unnamed protein product [Pedinophyceae sp. YPF-701]|nr:unnamed protein product [Pedinophyceae sp. YPF-701]